MLYLFSNETETALISFTKSAQIFEQIGNRAAIATALGNLMFAANQEGNSPIAIANGKRAVNILQEIRNEISEKDSQQSFLRSRADTYRMLAELLVRAKRLPEAERVLEMLKEEEFAEYRKRDAGVAKELQKQINLGKREKEALEEYLKHADEIGAAGEKLAALEKELEEFNKLTPNAAFPKQTELDELKKSRAAAERLMKTFIAALKKEFGDRDTRVAEVENNLQNGLKVWQEKYGERVAVISTIAGKENLNLILTTANFSEAHVSRISEERLDKLVQEFRQAVQDKTVDPRPLGNELYKVMLAPLEKYLKDAGVNTIVWSLDGNLRYVPVSALYDAASKKYLAERFANVVITLASRDSLGEAADGKKGWQVLGFGVSKEAKVEETDADGKLKIETFLKLDAVPQELRAIISNDKLCGTAVGSQAETGKIKGCRWLDDDFTKQRFESLVRNYRVVHIASHFNLRVGDEENSYLLLGGTGDRRYKVADLADQTNFFKGVELLTLSACETAFGGKGADGKEIESFGVEAQRQGAKAVLATLWKVADPSTRDFMVKFYELQNKNPQMSKAEAVRLAQLSIIYGKYTAMEALKKRGTDVFDMSGETRSQPLFKTDLNAPFAHPYFWSPFILIGNWR